LHSEVLSPFRGGEVSKDLPATVALRFQNGLPALVSKKVDAGEVLLLATAADPGWTDESSNPVWTDWPLHFVYVPFVDVAVAHLLHGQTQNHNRTAGDQLRWYPSDRQTRSFTLVHPSGVSERLGLPETISGRTMVTAESLTGAGVYRLVASIPAPEKGTGPFAFRGPVPFSGTGASAEEKKAGVPLAVTPDLRESENLDTFTDQLLDGRLGFTPIHLTADAEVAVTTSSDRLNREWTMWLLMAVLALVICEGLLAWWCGRAW